LPKTSTLMGRDHEEGGKKTKRGPSRVRARCRPPRRKARRRALPGTVSRRVDQYKNGIIRKRAREQ
jgi:hypothetical protein